MRGEAVNDVDHGEWNVDTQEDGSVYIRFDHLNADGVQMFETAMLPEHALIFATAILNCLLPPCTCDHDDAPST